MARRGKLSSRINEHQIRANHFLSSGSDPDRYNFETDALFYENTEGEMSLSTPNPFVSQGSESLPEKFTLSLPSSLSAQERKDRNISSATAQEIELRIRQCNDTLQGIRLALGKKAFLFRTQVRARGPKVGKTKSWDGINAAHETLREQAQLYRSARSALKTLDPDPEILEKYQLLEARDLHTSTTRLDDSLHGQKHGKLPWFWYLDVATDVTADAQLLECESHFRPHALYSAPVSSQS